MPSSAAATVIQNNLSGSQLLWSDVGTYTGVTSRILTILDYQGNIVLVTGNLTPNTSYQFNIISDSWYQFSGTTIDANGTWDSTVYFVATGFFWATYAEQFTSTNCGCQGNNWNMELGLQSLNAALRFNLAGASGAAAAQREILAANVFVNQSAIVTI